MPPRPLIGITAFATRHVEAPHLPIHALNQRYVSAVESAGGAPLIVPPGLDDASQRAIFARIDGLVLSGGGDIDPAYYGEAAHPALNALSAQRDRLELSFARWSLDEDKPLLAICRGIQVLNVALGGTLVQDIPTQVPDALPHNFDETRVARDFIAHEVTIEPGSRLCEVMGSERAGVNSWHHQSVKQAAPGLAIVACAPDGVIEGVERPRSRFTIGIQWHPEWLYDRQPEMKRLFAALVRAST